ncbi:MAG: aminotransferase class V-fold PLP-dependent enzyme [Arenicella sp.]
MTTTALENYFRPFRNNVVGIEHQHDFKQSPLTILYADWAASGRLYKPIEEYISDSLGPYVANTHTETSLTGCTMTHAYHQAREIIKAHVGANEEDVLLFDGFGMTAVVNKFQRMLNLRHGKSSHVEEQSGEDCKQRPLVVITHLEHHSNQISWLECDVDVVIIEPDGNGYPCLQNLEGILQSNESRSLLIGSFTACSNVSGIFTPYYEMAALMHKYGGYACVDFSGSAPYVDMNMHPENSDQNLDAIFFSPHKFLGGPGSSGILVFNKKMYERSVPDHPGGGTVTWTDPWGGHGYHADIETREDGGTPGFLQAIKASLAILLKDEMGVEKMLAREHEQKERLINGIKDQKVIHILELEKMQRLGFISFYSDQIHHNLFVKLLNDYYGIQARGGCSCAGTYGHILLGVEPAASQQIVRKIERGDLTDKPGWVRISLHPVMSNKEIDHLIEGINGVVENYSHWADDYQFNRSSGEYECLSKRESYINIKEHFSASII